MLINLLELHSYALLLTVTIYYYIKIYINI